MNPEAYLILTYGRMMNVVSSECLCKEKEMKKTLAVKTRTDGTHLQLRLNRGEKREVICEAQLYGKKDGMKFYMKEET